MSKGSNKKGWSESEKLRLLFSLMDTAGSIDWKRAVIPEGRTLKAAQLQFYEWKKVAGSSEVNGVPGGSPKKRKQVKKTSDEDDGADDPEESPAKKSKRGRKVKVEVKEEAAAIESEADWDDGEEA